MNRWLMFPGLCCLMAFAGLWIALHQATGRDLTAPKPQPMASNVDAWRAAVERNRGVLLSDEEGARLLTTLADEYHRPWREWQQSPTRLYSRAAPRPLPTMTVEAKIVPTTALHGDNTFLATIHVKQRGRSLVIPCVVDRASSRISLFVDGQWLTADEWLKGAPLAARL